MNTTKLPDLKRAVLSLLDMIDDMDVDSTNNPLEASIHTLYMAGGELTDHLKDVVASPVRGLQSLDEAVAPEEAKRVAERTPREHLDAMQVGAVINGEAYDDEDRKWYPCTIEKQAHGGFKLTCKSERHDGLQWSEDTNGLLERKTYRRLQFPG